MNPLIRFENKHSFFLQMENNENFKPTASQQEKNLTSLREKLVNEHHLEAAQTKTIQISGNELFVDADLKKRLLKNIENSDQDSCLKVTSKF